MDSLVEGEWFIVRVRRNGGSIGEAAQLTTSFSGLET